MKLSYFENNKECVFEAYETLAYAKALANYTQKYVTVYNYQPGQHKHGSVYLLVTPDPVDTPLAEMYGG